MKNFYNLINKKKLLSIIFVLIFLLIIFFSSFYVQVEKTSTTPEQMFSVVIDAGHGGVDGGAIGVSTKIDENSLNLNYANTLKKYLDNYGIRTIMTRKNLNGLYSALSLNKKKDDMQKRKEIINSSNADIVISIHMNSHVLEESKGAQVFFSKNNENSIILAKEIQDVFISTLENARKEVLVGDYYILNCSNIPSVIVECGYLSNPEEEILLQDEEYMEKVCACIFLGVLNYLKN